MIRIRRSQLSWRGLHQPIFRVRNPRTRKVIGIRVFRTILLWGKGSS